MDYIKILNLHAIPHKDKVKIGLEIFANVLKIKNRNTLFT
jgi:hypothetical protein